MSKLVPDYSALSTQAECARKFQWQYRERLRSREPNAPLHAGSALHEALNYIYTEAWDFGAASELLADAWGSFRTPPNSKHGYLTLGHLQVVLANYMEEREAQPTALEESGAATQLAEEALVFDWVNSDGEVERIGGKPDLPRELSGRRYIVDHKASTIWVNSYWALKFKLGFQFRIYCAALKQLTGIRYEGAYVNGIYMGKHAADGPEKWIKRQSAPNSLFGPYHYSDEELDEAWAWASTLLDAREVYEARGFWPPNEQACGNYGGCEFIDLCSRPPKIRAALAAAQFEKWTPTGVLESGADGNERKAA